MELKVLIDRLQIQYMCCGSENYVDWFTTSWVNEEFLDVDDENIKSNRDCLPSTVGHICDITQLITGETTKC
uniref:Rod outer segment membrane protein 1 n=1 Tax=Magallana gigas TaxID=29159 RepID=K1QFM3_MAGGI